MIIRIISILLLAAAGGFFIAQIMDARKHKNAEEKEIEKKKVPVLFAAEILTWMLATFGVSDTAVNLLVFRLLGIVDARKVPGTVVVGATVPLCVMGFAYLKAVDVSASTLLILIVVQALGGITGSLLVSRLNVQVIRLVMSGAMLLTAFFLFAKVYLLKMEGGDAIGLSSWKLILAVILIYIMQCLVMLGFGNTTPNMSLLLMLGMSPLAVYPLVMSATSFGAMMGTVGFMKTESYNRKVALTEAVSGTIGVLIAVRLVSALNTKLLQLLMIAIMLYNAVMLFRDYRKARKTEQA